MNEQNFLLIEIKRKYLVAIQRFRKRKNVTLWSPEKNILIFINKKQYS